MTSLLIIKSSNIHFSVYSPNSIVLNSITYSTSQYDPYFSFQQYPDSSLLFVGSSKLFTPDYTIGKVLGAYSNMTLKYMNFTDPQYALHFQELALTPSRNAAMIGTNLSSNTAILVIMKKVCFPGEFGIMTEECISCFPGTANAEFDSYCSGCASGTYQPLYGQEHCLSCPSLSVQPYIKKTYCISHSNFTYNRTVLEKSLYNVYGVSVISLQNEEYVLLSEVDSTPLSSRIDIINTTHDIYSEEFTSTSGNVHPVNLAEINNNDFTVAFNLEGGSSDFVYLKRSDTTGSESWSLNLTQLNWANKLKNGYYSTLLLVGKSSTPEDKAGIFEISQAGNIINSNFYMENTTFFDVVGLSDNTIICVGKIWSNTRQLSLFVRLSSDLSIIIQTTQIYTEQNETFKRIIAVNESVVAIFGEAQTSEGIINSFYVNCDLEGNIATFTNFTIETTETNTSLVKLDSSILFTQTTEQGGKFLGEIAKINYFGTIQCINWTLSGFEEKFLELKSTKANAFVVIGSTTEHTKWETLLTIFQFPCNVGEYALNNECVKCPPGSYNPDTNYLTSCFKCAVGYYQNLEGQTNCIVCTPGTYQALVGQSECLDCPANTYTINSGSTYCQSCPTSFSSIDIEEQCTSCPDGYFYSSITACTKCHSNCAICNNSATNCTKCVDVSGIYPYFESPDIYSCLCNTSKGYFENGLGECTQCNLLCDLCNGSSSEDCISCTDDPLIIKSGTSCKCKTGYYYSNNASEICKKCDEFCTACNSEVSNCSQCISHPGIQFVETTSPYGNCLCIEDKYYVNDLGSSKECSQCHPLCLKCSGNSTSECYSCDNSLGAEFQAPSTCKCKSGYYYNSEDGICSKCNSLCSECAGSTNADCTACATDISFLFPSTNLCVEDCAAAGSYYNGNGTCKECNSNCLQCYGPDNDNCYSCSDSTLYLLNGSCVGTCPSHFFADKEKNCIQCHDSCGNCVDSTKSGCLTCNNSDLLLFNNECVENCPSSLYKANSTICLPCNISCSTCISESSCTSCAEGYYLISSKQICVSDCPAQTYQDSEANICKSCHSSCLTCSGPSFSECLSCFYGIYNNGVCQPIICITGQYAVYNNQTNTVSCLSCPEACEECSSETTCTSCKDSFHLFGTSCLSCKQYNDGFTEGENGVCTEVCGDGKNLGEHQCDDGNTRNGDGCSSTCKVESGYKCVSVNQGADSCIKTSSPTAVLRVISSTQLQIVFSELIQLNTSKDIFTSTLSLKFSNSKCSLKWEITDNLDSSKSFRSFYISISFECSYQSQRDAIKLYFSNPQLLEDLDGNPYTTTLLTASFRKSSEISSKQLQSVESTGLIFSITTLFTYCLALFLLIFQSIAINSFWSLVNMLQFISYLPIIGVRIPSNLLIFLTQYLTINKMSFPFSIFPDSLMKPFMFFKESGQTAYNERFEICGYESINFLNNFSDEIITWMLLCFLYSFVSIFNWIFPFSGILKRMKGDFEFNVVIRVLLECFLNLAFCIFTHVVLGNFGLGWASLIAIVIAWYIMGGFLGFSLRISEKKRKQLEKEKFKNTFGSLMEDLNIKSKIGRTFYPIFLVRRILYVMILVLLIDYPFAQLFLIEFVLIIPYLLYMWWCRPFSSSMINYINIYNEFILFVAFLFSIMENITMFNPKTLSIMGWIVISTVILSIFATWISLIPEIINAISSSKKGKIFPMPSLNKNFSNKKDPNLPSSKLPVDDHSETQEPFPINPVLFCKSQFELRNSPGLDSDNSQFQS